MLLTTNNSLYSINSYSDGLTQVSFDLEGDINSLKPEFADVTEATITDDEGVEVATFENLIFKSATVYTDEHVTATFTFPEVSTLDGKIAELQKSVNDIDDLMAELLYGGAF